MHKLYFTRIFKNNESYLKLEKGIFSYDPQNAKFEVHDFKSRFLGTHKIFN
jgi:hypothetical protein